MEVANVDLNKVSTIKGNFEQTLNNELYNKMNIENALIVHIDCDIYKPTLYALNFISSIMINGGLILFDDYDHMGANQNLGERKAVKEWLSNNKSFSLEEYRKYGTFCRSFIFHKSQ